MEISPDRRNDGVCIRVMILNPQQLTCADNEKYSKKNISLIGNEQKCETISKCQVYHAHDRYISFNYRTVEKLKQNKKTIIIICTVNLCLIDWF